jgi:peptidoglycan hydrolase-like protein with peptidoglycan-binding domain
MRYILTERQLKVLVEQTTKQTIPQKAYQKMIDGAWNSGTNPEDIVDGINLLNTKDEFYALNDLFKLGDFKRYRSFDQMIRGEFEYGGILGLYTNEPDIKKITKKLKELGVPFNYGSKNLYKDFTVPSKRDAQLDRQKKINAAWCNVKFGLVENQRSKIQWCGKGGYKEQMQVTDLEFSVAQDNCSKIIFSTPELTNRKEGFNEIYNYYRKGVDESTIKDDLSQRECAVFYEFSGINKDGSESTFFSDGELYYKPKGDKGLTGKWSWDGKKPVLELPLTRKAVGYAQTVEDIKNNNKILYTGSNNDLVKRVQFEIMVATKGKTNSGCKKDENGKYKSSLCDGIFGPKTKKAVQDFQKSEGLKDKSGIVGAETWGLLDPYDIDSYEYTQEELEKS